jgi:hypothetical protein
MRKLIAFFICSIAMLTAGTAEAYVGPGLGLGAIGAVLGVVLSVLLAIFAVFWYPLKRLIAKRKATRKSEKEV